MPPAMPPVPEPADPPVDEPADPPEEVLFPFAHPPNVTAIAELATKSETSHGAIDDRLPEMGAPRESDPKRPLFDTRGPE